MPKYVCLVFCLFVVVVVVVFLGTFVSGWCGQANRRKWMTLLVLSLRYFLVFEVDLQVQVRL